MVKRIRRWLPDTYILENVKGLTFRRNRKFFNRLLRLFFDCTLKMFWVLGWKHVDMIIMAQAQSRWSLWSLLEGSHQLWSLWNLLEGSSILNLNIFWAPCYRIFAQVMDCFQYGGLPQRRPRLWIVGLNKYAVKSTLAFAVCLAVVG